jgi:hypothetical protein
MGKAGVRAAHDGVPTIASQEGGGHGATAPLPTLRRSRKSFEESR